MPPGSPGGMAARGRGMHRIRYSDRRPGGGCARLV